MVLPCALCAWLLLAVAGCQTIDQIAPPVGGEVLAFTRGVPATQLEADWRIYLSAKCTACHGALPVTNYPASRWPQIVAKMGGKSRLTPQEHEQLLAYVLAVTQR